MEAGYGILGIAVTALVAVFILGWIAPLVMGILRRRRAEGGLALIIIGGVWGLASLLLICFFVRQIQLIEDGGTAFNPAKCRKPMGSIVLPYSEGGELQVFAAKKPLLFKKPALLLPISDGAALAPIGNYKLGGYRVAARDAENVRWTASSRGIRSEGGRKEIRVRADSITRLDFGKQFTARVNITDPAPELAIFNLEITDSDGESCDMRKNGDSIAEFQVLDKKGSIIWEGKFDAG